MKQSTSFLTAIALGSLLAVAATTPSMAREMDDHRIPGPHARRCNDGAAGDRGFGGFSGAPGHPFIGPGIGGKDWGGNWGEDPFWATDPYYPSYDGTAYIEPGRHARSPGRTARHGEAVGPCS